MIVCRNFLRYDNEKKERQRSFSVKEGYYLIGEVSKITGIPKDTLHFYSKTGLLVPDYVDECNQYRYYSRFNLWQLDIITTCRKLSIPLEKVKQILELHDNAKITQLLLDYRSEALRLSRYYQQVARDISWYEQENIRISAGTLSDRVEKKWLEEEKFITGARKKDPDYHANLQKAAKDELRYAETIQRKYGYFLDLEQMKNGIFFKDREYLKIADCSYTHVKPEFLYTFPAGEYAVCFVHIRDGAADFGPLLRWIEEHGWETDAVYAEELGLQLFDYIDDFYCEVKAHLTRKPELP